jgi:protein-S-isoprenylcysteine O-methyltransferase Ste14
VTPWLYRIVRHPLYVGWLLIFWGTPTMTAGHLLFATVMSGYILVGMRYEERDLVEHIGEPYRRYKEEVPALIPTPGRRATPRRATS